MIRIRVWERRAAGIGRSVFIALALTLGALTMAAGPQTALAEGRYPVLKPQQPEPLVLSRNDAKALKDLLSTARKRGWRAAIQKVSRVKDPLARKLVQWLYLQSKGSGATFETINAFLEANPDWPRRERLLRRAEEAMPDDLPAAYVMQWFAGRDPFTGDGMLRLGETYLEMNKTVVGDAWIRRAWRDPSLTREGERAILARHKKRLSRDDHNDRIDRLIWDGKTSAARRMYELVSDPVRKLADARIRLRTSASGVDAAISAVPDHLKEDPGLVFERVRWRRRRDRDRETWPLLLNAPPDAKTMRSPSHWWTERHIQARLALKNGQADIAYQLVRNHGLEQGADFATAEWKSGWLALRFLNRPAEAQNHFETLATNVSFPISVARGHYWKGRAAEAAGRLEAANHAYRLAAAHSTTFYGQLAAERVANGDPFLRLPQTPYLNPSKRQAFFKTELAQAAMIASDFADDRITLDILSHMAQSDPTAERFAQVADLARFIGETWMSVRIGKRAMQRRLPAIGYAYPVYELLPYIGKGEEPERALVLALIRQETEFKEDARSHANARGLMQLLRGTARQVARRHGLAYRSSWLTKRPDYNSQLGRAYLADLLKDYDGSYIMAAAAYNAGPSRVNRWIKDYGDPRDSRTDPVDWVESIPFSETRNYVQRILETTTVYRNLLSGQDYKIMLSQDLRRSASATPVLVATTPLANPEPRLRTASAMPEPVPAPRAEEPAAPPSSEPRVNAASVLPLSTTRVGSLLRRLRDDEGDIVDDIETDQTAAPAAAADVPYSIPVPAPVDTQDPFLPTQPRLRPGSLTKPKGPVVVPRMLRRSSDSKDKKEPE